MFHANSYGVFLLDKAKNKTEKRGVWYWAPNGSMLVSSWLTANIRDEKFSKSLPKVLQSYRVTFIIRSFTFLQQIESPKKTVEEEGGGSNWDCTPLSVWSMKLLHFLQEIRVMHRTPQAFTAPGYLAQRVQYEQRKTQSFCGRMLIATWIPLDQKPKNDWRCKFTIHTLIGRIFCAVPLYIFPFFSPASSLSGTWNERPEIQANVFYCMWDEKWHCSALSKTQFFTLERVIMPCWTWNGDWFRELFNFKDFKEFPIVRVHSYNPAATDKNRDLQTFQSYVNRKL